MIEYITVKDAQAWAAKVGKPLPRPVVLHPRRWTFESLRDALGPMRTIISALDSWGSPHGATIEWLPDVWTDDGVEKPRLIWGAGDSPAHVHVSRGGLATVATTPRQMTGANARIFEGTEVDGDLYHQGTFRIIGIIN